jgi:hypothetical protein
LAIVLMVAAGCGGEVAPDDVLVPPARAAASLEQLIGPWQPRPYVLDAATATRIGDACRRDIEFPRGSMPVVIDVRGAGVATVRMSGVESGSCDALEITARGEIAGAGGGWRGGNAAGPPLGNLEVSQVEVQMVAGGELKVEGVSVYGRAGPGVTEVRIETTTGVTVVATLHDGWFAAWWPQPVGDRFDPAQAHFAVRAHDAAGTIVDEVIR